MTSKPKILIAEDNEILRKIMELHLSKENIEVFFAENGLEAITTCISNPDFKLILMNYEMPVMDGGMSAIKIKRIRPGLPIIVHSAHPEFIIKQICIEFPFDDYLCKPYKPEELIDKINKFLK